MKIGKYKILETLGEGGMGIVYKAFDANMEREVAIKVLSEQPFAKPDLKKRFFQEARSAGKLSHENITIAFDLGELEGKPYIVMEYLTGTDLATIIEQKERLTLNEKLDYALQICKGLEYSHSKYIIHRDINPANIRVLEGGRIKIMDLGLTKPVESNLTGDGVVMGTPHYMSPEQIQDEHIDNRSDIFSFGALFYELLSFERPFAGDDTNSVIDKIVHEKPAPIDDTKIENVSSIKSIVSKCLEKNVDERYQSFTEIIEDLDEVLRARKSKEKHEIQEKRKKIENLVSAAEHQLKKKNLKKAASTANKAAGIEPRNTLVLALMDRIETELEIEKTNEFIREKLKEAKKLNKTKQYEKTIETIEEVLKIEPNNAEGLKLVEEAIDLGNLEKGSKEIPVTEIIDKRNNSNGQKNRKFLIIGAISLISAALIALIIMFIMPQFKESAENKLAIILATQEKIEAQNAQLKVLLMKERAEDSGALANAEKSYGLAEQKNTQGKNAFEQDNYRDAKVAFEVAAVFYELAAETAKKNIETRDRLIAERKVLSAKERFTLAVRDSTVEMRMIASLTPAADYASEDFETAMAKLEAGNKSYQTRNCQSAINYFREAREYFEKAQETAFTADSLIREIDKLTTEIFQMKNEISSKLNTITMDSLLNISYQQVMNIEPYADSLYVIGNFDSALSQYRLTQEMYEMTLRLLDEQIKREKEKELSKDFIAQSDPPQPLGGLAAIYKNLKYPKSALRATIEGRVIVRVLINEEGQVVDTEILTSLTLQCDKAAVAAIKSVRWKPAMQQGNPVKLWYTIPITFKIEWK